VKLAARQEEFGHVGDGAADITQMLHDMGENDQVELAKVIRPMIDRAELGAKAQAAGRFDATAGKVQAAQVFKTELFQCGQQAAVGAANIQDGGFAIGKLFGDAFGGFRQARGVAGVFAAAGARFVVLVFGEGGVKAVVIGLGGGGVGKNKTATVAHNDFVAVAQRVVVR